MVGRDREDRVNYAIADIINEWHGNEFEAEAQKTGMFEGGNWVADIIINSMGGGSCVIIETEWIPARTLGEDVRTKMRRHVKGIGKPAAVVGVRIPAGLKMSPTLKADLESLTDLEYFVLRDGDAAHFFPRIGYLKGSLTDIITAVRLSMVPKQKIETCVKEMISSITKISTTIEKGTGEDTRRKIADLVRENAGDGGKQTWDMAALILLNAGIFHEELAVHHDAVPSIDDTGSIGTTTKKNIMDAWTSILKINYHPIFSTAINILRVIPMRPSQRVVDEIRSAVSTITGLHVQKSGDVYGLLYQRMLKDRDNAAAYYTRPQAAALLAALVMPTGSDSIYGDARRIKALKIADFACGTGMLLTAVYSHIINNARNIDIKGMHQEIMEDVLYGYDIMPTATHITASNLAGLFPEVKFEKSNIHRMLIGPSEWGYHLGSLDLLVQDTRLVKVGERHHGIETKEITAATVPDGSLDRIIMNPPYASTTKSNSKNNERLTAFAVFGTSEEDQVNMGKLTGQIYKDTCSHGHAGLASYFIAIADRKLKRGGTMGLILPATMTAGTSWKAVRALFGSTYDNIMVAATTTRSHISTFSSETGINEIMVVARKKYNDTDSSRRIKLVLLDGVPASRLEAIETAKAITNTRAGNLESMMGGASLLLGNTTVGGIVDTAIEGDQWIVGRALNIKLFQYAHSVTQGLGHMPITRLGSVACMGKHPDLIKGHGRRNNPWGPFNKMGYNERGGEPCLWNNNVKFQKCMVVGPDCTLEAKHDATKEQLNDILNTKTRVHVNLQVRYTSQRLIAAYTNEPMIGGRTWPNVVLRDKKYEKTLAVWCNSIFGIMTYWLVAGSQNIGRGMMSRGAFESFPVPNFAKISKERIMKINRIFDDLCHRELLAINRLDEDKVRQELDRRLCVVLGIKHNLTWVYQSIVREPQLGRTDIWVAAARNTRSPHPRHSVV